MAEPDVEQLLGGFATNTLTADERKALYDAALRNQQLFDMLADEQALKELLNDPVTRRQIAASIRQGPAAEASSWLGSVSQWIQRPTNLALTGGLATAVIAAILFTRVYEEGLRRAQETTVTEDRLRSVRTEPEEVPAVSIQESESRKRSDMKSSAAEHQRVGTPSEPTSVGDSPIPARSPSEGEHNKRELPVAEELASADRPPAGGHKESGSRKDNRIAPSKAKDRTRLDQRQSGDAAPTKSLNKKQEVTTRSSTAVTEQLEATTAPPGKLPSRLAQVRQLSARALFYGASPGQQPTTQPGASVFRDDSVASPEQEEHVAAGEQDRLQPVPAAPPSASESRIERPTYAGLRYSFISRTPQGDIEREPTAAWASDQDVHLTVEANSEGYLVVWEQVGEGSPMLLFPNAGEPLTDASKPARLRAGVRQVIPLPKAEAIKGHHSRKLGIRWSRTLLALSHLLATTPHAPGTEPKLSMGRSAQPGRTGRPAAPQDYLVETIGDNNAGARPERAVYVMRPAADPAGVIWVDIPLESR